MKQKNYQRWSRPLLLTLLSILMTLGGASPAWAQTTILSEDFESNSLSTNEWTTVNPGTNASAISTDAKRNGTYGYKFCYYSSSKPSNSPRYLISKKLSIPANASNINLSFFYSRYTSGSEKFAVGYSTTTNEVGAFTWSGDITNAAYNSWKEYNLELNKDVKYIAIQYKSGDQYYLYIDDITITCDIVEGPGFAVKDGSTKLSSPYAYSFGLTTSGSTKTFKLTNPGTAATPISVDVSGANGFTAAVEDNATSIPAGGEKTLTITMPDATASGSVVVTPTGDGLSAFTFNVSGTVRDPNKVYLDFSDGQIPDGWTSVRTGSYGSAWAASTGYISQSGGYSSYAWAFTSPKLNFENGEEIFFETAKYDNYAYYSPSITVEYTKDATGDTGWTAIGSAFTDDAYGNWTKRCVTIPEEGVKRIRFNGWYIHMRNIYGGEEPNEPKMVVTQPTTLDFGLYDKDADPAPTKTFTIANTGKATLSGISVSSANAAFTITGAPTSLAAGASKTVTITMSTATAGALSSLITVSATDMEDASFTVTGTVKPAGMPVEDFSGTTIPDGWSSTGSWSFTTDGVAIGTGSSAYLYTPKLKFNAGDFIIIKAKNTDGDASDYITVAGSVNEGTDNYTAYSKKITVANNSDYATFIVTDIPTTINKIRFTGGWVNVDEIHGLTYAPVLVVKDAEDAVQASPVAYAFGEQGANASVAYSFTNGGAGTLNITNVVVTNDPDDGTYTTNWTESVATPFNLVITQNYDAEKAGAKTGSVVVTMSDASTFTINLSGTLLAANAPTLAVDNTLEFGKLTANDTQTVTVTNSGTGSMTVNIESDNALFTVSPAELTEIGAGASKTFDVTFHYDQVTAGNYGVKNANITVTPTYNAEAAVVISASAKAKDPEEWGEVFAGNAKPDGWENDNTSGWTFADGVAKGHYVYNSSYYLTTPSLKVDATSDVLTFDYVATGSYVSVTIQKSKNGGAWESCSTATPIGTLNNGDAGTATITGLEAGNYKFRFKNDDYNLDNFEGFKLTPIPAHEAVVKDKTIPTTGNQYVEYTASVNVEVTGTSDEQLTVKFFIGDTQYGESVVKDVTSGYTESFEVTFTPNAAVSGDAYFTIESANIAAFESDKVAVNIAAATVYDEKVAPSVSEETIESLNLIYTAKDGWNTICVPFALTTDMLNSIFGTGWKAYEFESYSNGELGFNSTTSFSAGYPYVIYVETAASPADGVKLQNVSVTRTTAQYDHYNGAYFRGTYTPIAAGGWTKNADDDKLYGVTAAGKIAKIGAETTSKGFRGYFDLPAGATARLSFYDETTGITTVMDAKELNNDGKVYNLNGQRVENAKKGLYIVNGRKVVVK